MDTPSLFVVPNASIPILKHPLLSFLRGENNRARRGEIRPLESGELLKLIEQSLAPLRFSLSRLPAALITELKIYKRLKQQVNKIVTQGVRDHLIHLSNGMPHSLQKSSDITKNFSAYSLSLKQPSEQRQNLTTSVGMSASTYAPSLKQSSEQSWNRTSGNEQTSSLYAVCLAPFELRQDNNPIELCTNRNGQALLRYLIAQKNHSATADTLMTLLWPDNPTDVALNKLYVTVSLLRRSLQKGQKKPGKYIVYKQGVYHIDPALKITTDFEEFLRLYQIGRKERDQKATEYYEQACLLYKRPFLQEDLYASWSFQQREHLRHLYIEMCHKLAFYHIDCRSYEQATQWVYTILEENQCDEEAHRHLMRIHAHCGRRHDVIRQYHLCQQILLAEMEVEPMPVTVDLFKSLMRGELV
jgi:DNA-binding SARP family transcriptional activator